MKTPGGTCIGIEEIFSKITVEPQKKELSPFHKKKKRAIVIAGPTACGKSTLAIRLAQILGGEIISADSMQVYQGMDIGTAKVSKEERLLIPHHLIDICSIQESFNVVQFYEKGRQALVEIFERDNVPIIVGGSGFYIHTLIYGPPHGPPSIPELRKKLEEEIEKKGADFFYEKLFALDPLYATSITQNDKQKIARALEIMQLTQKRVSDFSWKERSATENYDFCCWFIYYPKIKLYPRIEKRCEAMLAAGFIDEVRALEIQGLRNNPTASSAIGYKQVLDFLKTSQTPKDYDHLVKVFKQASRRYAKRQFTWFKEEPLFPWVDIDKHEPEAVLDMIQKNFESLL